MSHSSTVTLSDACIESILHEKLERLPDPDASRIKSSWERIEQLLQEQRKTN